MTQDKHERLKQAVWAMPYMDRAALLSLSIIEKNRSEIGGLVVGLVELAARMAPFMKDDLRFRIADRIRDTADRIERVPSELHVSDET